MPNYVINKIDFLCDKDTILRIKECLKSDFSAFDFNNIIPMSEDLQIPCSSSGDKGLKSIDSGNYENVSADDVTLGQKYLKNIAKHGHPNWYSWSIEKWGTKWNACYVDETETGYIFETAWSSPVPIFEALFEKFAVPFSVQFADENLGYNCGEITATEEDGFCVNYFDGGSRDALELAFALHGEDINECGHFDDNDNFIYND